MDAMDASRHLKSYELTPHTFRFIWLVLIVLHGFVTLYLLAYAAMYALFYSIPLASYYVTTFQLLPTSEYRTISAAYLAFAALYAQQLLRMLVYSVRHRSLRFGADNCNDSNSAVSNPQSTIASRLRQRIPRRIRDAYAAVFGVHGLLGVRGIYFSVMTLLRELLEVGVQVSQAYLSSRYTGSRWINLTFGGLIVVNCFSTPLVHLCVRGSGELTGAFRLIILVVDLALDLVWFLVLPVLFWIPYVNALLGSEALLFEDTFMAQALMELRFLFVTSFGDLVFGKLLPALSLFLTVRKIQLLVRKQGPLQRQRDSCRTSTSTQPRNSNLTRIHPESGGPAALKVASSPPRSSKRNTRRVRCLEAGLTMMLTATGCVAVAVYAVAYGVYQPDCTRGCKLELRPWFVVDPKRCYCAVQEINCHVHGLRGEAHELTTTLASIEADGLFSLMLTHCPELTVPSEITRFHELFRFEIFNCSIQSWDESASITAEAFPRLGLVQLIHTFLHELPRGIAHNDLPIALTEIQIVASNLTSLPPDLGALWPHVKTLFLEQGRFVSFPTTLSTMPNLQSLSLFGNGLTAIADDAFSNNSLEYLLLNNNPITAIPTSLRNSLKLVNLHLMNTRIPNVTSATSWVHGRSANATAMELLVFGYGSPFCDDPSEAVAAPWPSLRVVCHERTWTYRGETAQSWYPLDAKLKERRLA